MIPTRPALLSIATALTALAWPALEGCDTNRQSTFPALQSQECAGGSCGIAIPPNGGAVRTDDTSGNGGASGSTGALTNSLLVTVESLSISDLPFRFNGTYVKSANVVAPTAASVVASVWNGSTAVALENVIVGNGWFSVKPLNDALSLGTLSLLDIPSAPAPYTIKLPLVPTDDLTTLFNQFPTNDQTPDLSAAQAVVTFVDSQSQPLPGVTVSLNLNAQIFYDGNSTKTGPRGVAYLLNITGTGTNTTTLSYTQPGASTPLTTELRLQNSVVSLLSVLIKN